MERLKNLIDRIDISPLVLEFQIAYQNLRWSQVSNKQGSVYCQKAFINEHIIWLAGRLAIAQSTDVYNGEAM